MENPFESGHIRNYILFYASVVLVMILFFFASSLYNDVAIVEKKIFTSNPEKFKDTTAVKKEKKPTRFKLLDKAY